VRVVVREDVPGAYVVESGDQTYSVYVGLDIAYPSCDCPSAIYRNVKCKHVRAVEQFPNGTDV